MSVFASFLAAIRRFFGRRAARKLLAQNLPKGLPEPTGGRWPVAGGLLLPDDAPPLEFWTLPIGRKPPAPLFRIVALPPTPKRLDVIRELPQISLGGTLRLPRTLAIPPPLESAIADLGAARPRSFRLDADLRLPPEVDPLRLPVDRAPTKTRRVRPRTPLGRAPIDFRFRPAHFRLDKNSLKPANEGIVPLEMRDTTYRWVLQAFRRRFLDLPWMAQERIRFLGPLQYEWFLMWWDESTQRSPGAGDPLDWPVPREVDWALEVCKEQMLIRRDAAKDENPPEPEEFGYVEIGHPIRAHERKPPAELVPKTEWIEATRMLPPPTQPPLAREAYLQWRTLVDALEER